MCRWLHGPPWTAIPSPFGFISPHSATYSPTPVRINNQQPKNAPQALDRFGPVLAGGYPSQPRRTRKRVM